MIASIVVGSMLTVTTVGIHALGTSWWIRRLKRAALPATAFGRQLLPFRLLCSTALVLLLLHMAEVFPWACTYLTIPNLGSLDSWEEATYFATVTFSSLGYGDIVIQGPWRLLSAIQAVNGLLVFGWSTALLFAVVERIWGKDQETQVADSDRFDDSTSLSNSTIPRRTNVRFRKMESSECAA